MALPPNDRAIARFTMLGHGLVHWFETAIPIFLVVWLAELDVSVALIGFVVALGYAPFGIGALPAGVLADRYGEKRLILVCIAGMSIAFLVIALRPRIWSIALGLFLWGVAASLYHPAGLSLISTGVDSRGSVFAWHGIAGNFGIALGPFTAAILLIAVDWQLVAALLALPGILAVAYGFRVTFDPTAGIDDPIESTTDGITLTDFLADSRVLLTSTFAFVFVIVTFEGLFYRGILTYLPEILHGLPVLAGLSGPRALEGIQASDFIYVGLLVVGMAGQFAGGKATERIDCEVGLGVIFFLLVGLALLFLPTAALGLGPLLVLCAVIGFFLFAIQPFYQEAVAVHTPPEGRGLSYGYTYLGEFGLGSASVAVGGIVLGSFELAAFFFMLSTFALAGGFFSALLWTRR